MPSDSSRERELMAGMAPLAPAARGVSLAYVEGMESVSQWIDGRYVVADDWDRLS